MNKPVCNEDCFNCVHPDCIVDETPSEAKARRKREWRQRHREEIAKKSKAYYEAHREERLAYQREYWRKKKKEAANAL